MSSKEELSNKLVISVFPHIEEFSTDFNDWVYYITFGYNVMIDHFIDIKEKDIESRIQYVIDNKDDVINSIKGKAIEFERTCLQDVKDKLGQGIKIEFPQFFSANGESMGIKITNTMANKISQLKNPSKSNISKKEYVKMVTTRATIFGVPINISDAYNDIFKHPQSIALFNKAHSKTLRKTLILYILSEAIKNYSPDEFRNKIFNNFNKKKDILSIKYDDLTWESIDALANKTGKMCREYFGSTDYSVSYSNLNKYGYSATPRSFVESMEK